jgi:hypothetical protein
MLRWRVIVLLLGAESKMYFLPSKISNFPFSDCSLLVSGLVGPRNLVRAGSDCHSPLSTFVGSDLCVDLK